MMLPVVAPVRASTDSTWGTMMAMMSVPAMMQIVIRLNFLGGMGSATCSSKLEDWGGGREGRRERWREGEMEGGLRRWRGRERKGRREILLFQTVLVMYM